MSSRRSSPTFTPHGESTFECIVRHLRLSPSEYLTSRKLKEWVRRNKDSKYVPPQLLLAWGFEVDGELFGQAGKASKRVA